MKQQTPPVTSRIKKSKYKIYPSPLTNQSLLMLDNEIQKTIDIKIFDLKGTEYFTIKTKGTAIPLIRSDFKLGQYMVEISVQNSLPEVIALDVS